MIHTVLTLDRKFMNTLEPKIYEHALLDYYYTWMYVMVKSSETHLYSSIAPVWLKPQETCTTFTFSPRSIFVGFT